MYGNDTEKMALCIELAGQNIRHGTGGPFGAAIFNISSGHLISAGVNTVVASGNSMLHAEVMAIMFAQQYLQTFPQGKSLASLELFTSCEPCAMCMGATLWSGVSRLACAATGDDARSIGFDEGPVFEASFHYLEDRGISITREICRSEAKAVLDCYSANKGLIYNAGNSGPV